MYIQCTAVSPNK